MRIICVIFLSLSLNILLSAEDQQFAVTFHAESKGGGPDTFVLHNGTLQSRVIEKHYKFKPAKYTLIKEGDAAVLTAILKSKKHGTVLIKGVIAEDGTIAGLRIWSKPKKKAIVHAFTGVKK